MTKELKIESFTIQSDVLVFVYCINGTNYIVALDPIVNGCKILLGGFIDATRMYVSCDTNLDSHHMVGLENP